MDNIIIHTNNNVAGTVIWLHGLGADGNDFAGIVHMLHRSYTLGVKFIFPTAPVIKVTINNGMQMNAWYDIKYSLDAEQDFSRMLENSQSIIALVEQEIANGIDASKIIVAGFSQGGVIALTAGMITTKYAIGGIIALSTYVPDIIYTATDLRKLTTKLFWGHGTRDQVVPIELGRRGVNHIKQYFSDTTIMEYAIDHTVNEKEIEDIDNFIYTVLA